MKELELQECYGANSKWGELRHPPFASEADRLASCVLFVGLHRAAVPLLRRI